MISSSDLDKFAWLNAEYVKGPVSGIVLRFPGLGSTGMKTDPDPADLEWGQVGALTVLAYQDPWGWMNPQTRNFIDDLVEVIRQRHGLGPKVPLISTGGSMGGHAALLYAIKSRHAIAACEAIFPVCDLPFHYTERVDLPRTMHHAFGNYGNIDAVLRENSPLHLVGEMRDIPYLFVHGEADKSVGKATHSDPMVAAMRRRKLKVEYIERAKLGHGGPMTYEISRRIVDFVVEQLKA